MRKMLKHDLKAIWPVWRIVAPIVVVLAALAGVVVGIGYSDYEIFDSVYWLFRITALLIDTYWYLILSAFSMLVTVLIVVRYYKNFFTDEGYLTFTLPVSRTKLLNSKILMALIWISATLAVCILAALAYSFAYELTLSSSGYMGDIFEDTIEDSVESAFSSQDIHILLFVLEVLYLAAAWLVSNLLLLLLCITVGAVIVKRAKLVLGLGIYYGANAVIVGIFYTGIIVGIILISSASEVSEDAVMYMLHAVFLMGGTLFSALGVGAYLLNKKLINKHLNLP